MRTFFYLVPLARNALPYRGHCALPLSMLSLFYQQTSSSDTATVQQPLVQDTVSVRMSTISMPDLMSTISYSARPPEAAASATAPVLALPTSIYLPRRSAAISVPS